MKQRSFLNFLAVGVVVLLLIGATGCNKSPLSQVSGAGTTRSPSAAMFVLKQAPVMVSMLVNPDR